MAIVVDQKRLGGGSHSTVGTITDIYTAAAAALLAGRAAVRRAIPTSSRSTTRRACARSATGWAASWAWTLDNFLDTVQIAQRRCDPGAGLCASLGAGASYASLGLVRHRQEAGRLHDGGDGPAAVRQAVQGQDASSAAGTINLTFEGIIDKFTSKYIKRDLKTCRSAPRRRWSPTSRWALPALQRRPA